MKVEKFMSVVADFPIQVAKFIFRSDQIYIPLLP